MRIGNKSVDYYIDLLIQSFKLQKLLPYSIRTGSSCPDKKKNCRKKHGEIIIKEFNPNNGKFHVYHYTVHNSKSVFDYWQEEKIVKEMILKSAKKFSYGKRPLLRIKEIKKILKNQNIMLSDRVSVRCSHEEKDLLKSDAKKNNMKYSDYVRKKLFSL